MTDRNEALRLAEYARGDEYQRATEAAIDLINELDERIAELEKEALAKPFAPDWAGYRQGLEDGRREGQAERDQLRAEVERLRVDAERYRWLADCENFYEAICLIANPSLTEHDLGAAIDQARTTHKETE